MRLQFALVVIFLPESERSILVLAKFFSGFMVKVHVMGFDRKEASPVLRISNS